MEVTIKPAHLSCPGVCWSFGAYHLHSLFSCCCLCLQDHQGQYVNFKYFHKYICQSSKTIYLKTKTGLCDCYICVIVKRCHLYRLDIANIDPRFCQTNCLKKRGTNYKLQTMKVTMKSCCQLAPICRNAFLDVNISI